MELNGPMTDKPVALGFQIEFNLEMLLLRRKGDRSTRRRTSWDKEITNNKLNSHMMLGLGIEPRTFCCEALTTAPSLLSRFCFAKFEVLPGNPNKKHALALVS